ncbi:hypothetical protein ACFWY5_57090 [Nonomuraea sp. NPDC059007]|uniref:hypothetical protein n=1 Tax=Nonomuraea sp. NPDC059007 TaxID=3346692 RepID=UPI0036C950C7
MSDRSQSPGAPKPAPDTETDATPALAPGEALSMEAIIEQARTTRRDIADDIARRLGQGEHLSAEQLYDTLRAQTIATWWLLVDRHIRHAGRSQGLTQKQTLAKFASWISSYLDHDDPTPDVAMVVGVLGPEVEHEFALIHLNRAMALIRRDAARTFIAQAEALAPASAEPEQAPSNSAGQEPTA